MVEERFSVGVHYNGQESHADLAPVLDELESMFGIVNITISRPDPNQPGRGGGFGSALQLTLDLTSVLDLAKVAAGIYAAAFIAALADADAKALRQKLLKIAVLDPRPSGNVSVTALAMSLVIGSVQFYVGSPMTEQELAIAFQQAKELVATMPDERIRTTGWPISWDAATKSWNDPLKGSPPPPS